jgi:hypothetical protein
MVCRGMKRILFAVHLDSFFTGLFGIASRFQRTGEYEPRMYFANRYPGLQRDIERCAREQVSVIGDADSERAAVAAQAGGSRRLRRAVAQRLPARALAMVGRSLPIELTKLSARIRQVRRMIRDEQAALLVLGGDIVHYDTAAFIKAAHEENIPAVVVAGWMVHQDENAEGFGYDPAYQCASWPNRAAALLYPRWSYVYKGRRLLRLPAARLLAREWLGIAPPKPWTLHSGHADAIAVESQATRAACLREGLPAAKIHVTGTINHDVMAAFLADAARRKSELCAELGLPEPERPLLVCALPPNEFYRPGGRPECDFTSHEQVVEFWIRTVTAAAGWNVVVSLHPSLLFEKMQPLERFGARIARRHTAELVSLCDLFVASVSTTIQWATACGKPVINYDVYRYRQHDYDEMGGMVMVEEQADFQDVVTRVTSNPTYRDELAAKQAACREHWGLLDGHAGDRLSALFGTLIASRGTQGS